MSLIKSARFGSIIFGVFLATLPLTFVCAQVSAAGTPTGEINWSFTVYPAVFCAANNLAADVEVIPIQSINDAYERMLKSDVKYRFAIDMESLPA